MKKIIIASLVLALILIASSCASQATLSQSRPIQSKAQNVVSNTDDSSGFVYNKTKILSELSKNNLFNGKLKNGKFNAYVSNKAQFCYYLYLPDDYKKDPNKKWPLIFFMHGSGEKGYNATYLDIVLDYGVPAYVKKTNDFPFIVICPQLYCDDTWVMHADDGSLNKLIDEVSGVCNVDLNRIYITGLSLGGIGTWQLGFDYPDKFAAIAPVCGLCTNLAACSDQEKIDKMKKLPVWAFHGAIDDIVPEASDKTAVDVLKNAGGNIKYTVYPGLGHDILKPTYENPELYKWLLSQSLNKRK